MSAPDRDLGSRPATRRHARQPRHATDRWRLNLERGARKIFSPLSARKPLKSHVSDERIQGKPMKSKPTTQGKSSEPAPNPGEAKLFQIAGPPGRAEPRTQARIDPLVRLRLAMTI